jgi:cell division protein FtsX
MRLRLPEGFAAFLIMATLTALAGLCALGGATVLERTGGWRARLAGEMTVAIRPAPAGTSDTDVVRAAEILAGTQGVAEVRVLDRSRVAGLLAPWTAGARGPDLAVLPRLIAVDLDGRAPAPRQALADALSAAGIDAIVDDHQGWRRTALDLRKRAAAPLIGALAASLAGLAALGSLAMGQEAERRRQALRTRLRLGESPRDCVRSLFLSCAPELGLGAVAGGLVAAGLGLASGLASGLAFGDASPEVFLQPAGILATTTAICALAAGAFALVAAFRRIREMEP